MPQAAAAAAISAFAAGLPTWATIAIQIGFTVVSGFAARALAPKPAGAAQVAGGDITLPVVDPATPRRLIVGEARVGGIQVFAQTKPSGQDNEDLYLVYVVGEGEVENALQALVINDEEVELNAEGRAVKGQYSGLVRAEARNGTADQTPPDWWVTSLGGKWTASDTLTGIAAVWLRLTFNSQGSRLFSSAPKITFVVRGLKLRDPRKGGSDLVWSTNVALIAAGYDTHPRFGLFEDEDIADADLSQAADDCDAEVPRNSTICSATTFFQVDAQPDTAFVYLGENNTARPVTGTRVRFDSDGALPAPLAPGTDYWWIFVSKARGRLAASLEDARAGTFISFSQSGAGPTLRAYGEPRYQAGGIITAEQEPDQVQQALLTAMGAGAALRVDTGGMIRYRAGVFRTPDVQNALGQDNLRAGGQVIGSFLVSRQKLGNRIDGRFRDPHKLGNLESGPQIVDNTAETKDGEPLYLGFDSPFTISPSTWQRLAKLELNRNRLGRRYRADMDMAAARVMPGDVVPMSLPNFGLGEPGIGDSSVQIRSWELTAQEVDGAILQGVNVEFDEVNAQFYDWDASEEVAVGTGETMSVR